MNVSTIIMVIMMLVTASSAQINNRNKILKLFLNSVLRSTGNGGNGITFPFTKWCGPGTRARHFEDLGPETGTDMCCREHDHCGLGINPGGELCEYKNNGFKISSCECDERFKECLGSVSSASARIITEIYRQFVRKCIHLDPFTGQCQVKRKVF